MHLTLHEKEWLPCKELGFVSIPQLFLEKFQQNNHTIQNLPLRLLEKFQQMIVLKEVILVGDEYTIPYAIRMMAMMSMFVSCSHHAAETLKTPNSRDGAKLSSTPVHSCIEHSFEGGLTQNSKLCSSHNCGPSILHCLSEKSC